MKKFIVTVFAVVTIAVTGACGEAKVCKETKVFGVKVAEHCETAKW